MWLLNTTTLKLEYFLGEVPSYAILSHRWEEKEELTFGDVTEASAGLKGYHKVKKFCEIAKSDGYDFGWADTCCIDKKSSAELSEAINSMFKWYKNSAICYAYLMDVNDITELESSSWWTRGWTLQELLAPGNLLFFDSNWNCVATKDEHAPKIAANTGIPVSALQEFDPREYCIAFKMSWAAQRETTREEDRAYSLLGLFDVNMPLLYGEGPKAFQRLQEEIMKSSIDASIFLWSAKDYEGFGMLADNPSSFANIPPDLDMKGEDDIFEYFSLPGGWTSSNAGITLSAHLRPYTFTTDNHELFILSLCANTNEEQLGIFLARRPDTEAGSGYFRASVDGKTIVDNDIMDGLYDTELRTLQKHQLLIMRTYMVKHSINSPFTFAISRNIIESKWCMTAHERPFHRGRRSVYDWPQVPSEDSPGKASYRFTVIGGMVEGILGVLVIKTKSPEVVALLIAFGYDEDFNAFCIALSVAKGAHELKFREKHLLAAYQQAIQRSTLRGSRTGSATATDDDEGSATATDDDEGVVVLRLGRLGQRNSVVDIEGVVSFWRNCNEQQISTREYNFHIDVVELLTRFPSRPLGAQGTGRGTK